MLEFVTGKAPKLRLSGNMLPSIKTSENWWESLLVTLRATALKLLELTQFASPNLSIYFKS